MLFITWTKSFVEEEQSLWSMSGTHLAHTPTGHGTRMAGSLSPAILTVDTGHAAAAMPRLLHPYCAPVHSESIRATD